MKRLIVKNQYLSWDDGTPFFYLGDTAWELAHALNREETELYFATRSSQGFNASQIVALAELDGPVVPNAYGRLPLLYNDDGLPDPTMPDLDGDYSYWDHIDYILDTAKKYGMFVTFLPTWGDKFFRIGGKGPEIFTPENAYAYGAFIGERFAGRWNVIYMLGGDRPLGTPYHRAIIDGMASGILSKDKNHLITFHPPGAHNSVEYLADADYIDMHSSQTGHGIEQCYESDLIMLEMRKTGKPYFDSEPRYEDIAACFDPNIGYFWNADDVRVNAYRDVLAGACGHTYGNNGVWSMTRKPDWFYPHSFAQAYRHPAAEMIHHVKDLRLSRPYFSMIPANELVKADYAGWGRVTAAQGDGYIFVYSPLGLPFTVSIQYDGAKCVKASWFNTRTGKETLFGVVPPVCDMTFAPPTSGHGCDWILILDRVNP